MSNIIGQIIAISRGIGRRRRFLKNRNMNNAKIEKSWQTIQSDLRVALINSFQISESDVVNFPQFLETNFDDIIKKLTPDIIMNLTDIINQMRKIEMFLSGMMAGFDSHRKTLGNYYGLIYNNYYDSPVGGQYDMIVVAKSFIASNIEHLGNMAGKIMHSRKLHQTSSKIIGLDGDGDGNGDVEVISICH